MEKQTTIKVATFLDNFSDDFVGTAYFYRIKPKIKWYDEDNRVHVTSFIVVSSTSSETFIFPANKKGQILSWEQLDGSVNEPIYPHRLLENLGYKIEGISWT